MPYAFQKEYRRIDRGSRRSRSCRLAKPASWLHSRAEKVYYHDWTKDPFCRGAYSYPKVGGFKAAQILAEPINGTIFFAGEAIDSQGAYGTVDAALNSGTSSARKIAEEFGACTSETN